MPSLVRCTRYEGKMYCWNAETRKIAVVSVKDLEFKDCPDYVIRSIIEYAREANNDE
jgi:hypothetical protein